MLLHHWNYLLAIEDDIIRLSRFVDFTEDNFDTYSVEIARILMAATQEIDVLAKQICSAGGDTSSNEAGYRAFFPTKYPNLSTYEVLIPRHDLTFVPFSDWAVAQTPRWWTANNKVKHHRHTHFQQASLQNMLEAVSALLLMNFLFYDVQGTLGEIHDGPRILLANGFSRSMSPTPFGTIAPNFSIPE